jgi:hypothetical protein
MPRAARGKEDRRSFTVIYQAASHGEVLGEWRRVQRVLGQAIKWAGRAASASRERLANRYSSACNRLSLSTGRQSTKRLQHPTTDYL